MTSTLNPTLNIHASIMRRASINEESAFSVILLRKGLVFEVYG